MGNKRKPKPLESSRSEKPPKEYSTPPQARGLLLWTNTRVTEEEELMVINTDSTKQSRVRLQLQPTLGARALPRPTLRPWAPPRPTSGGGLRHTQPQGRGLRLT